MAIDTGTKDGDAEGEKKTKKRPKARSSSLESSLLAPKGVVEIKGSPRADLGRLSAVDGGLSGDEDGGAYVLPTQTATAGLSLVKLCELKEQGLVTDMEFTKLKAALLAEIV